MEDVAQALRQMGDYLVRRLDTAADATAFLADDGRVRVKVCSSLMMNGRCFRRAMFGGRYMER